MQSRLASSMTSNRSVPYWLTLFFQDTLKFNLHEHQRMIFFLNNNRTIRASESGIICISRWRSKKNPAKFTLCIKKTFAFHSRCGETSGRVKLLHLTNGFNIVHGRSWFLQRLSLSLSSKADWVWLGDALVDGSHCWAATLGGTKSETIAMWARSSPLFPEINNRSL